MPDSRGPLLRERNFALYFAMNVSRALPAQIVAVAVGWQVYAVRHDPFDIGLVGLAEFLPFPLLALPAGHVADRISRRFVVLIALAFGLVDAVSLLVVTLTGAHRVWPFIALGVLSGVSLALGTPAARAMGAELVARELVAEAMALRTTANQIGIVLGPVLGGVLFAVDPSLAYAAAALFFGAAFICTTGIVIIRGAPATATPGLEHLLGGLRFLRGSNVVLGAILLDLFAVLFGGAVALLPVFAQSVLHVGPVGLGVLRASPAVGALVGGALLVRRPTTARAGPRLLFTVGLFGVSTIVFGLSHWLVVSVVALAVGGFADMASVNIRSSAVALATPDDLRGRVNAVEMVFISASNQLGAFESGAAAALVGTVPSVVAGGAATVAVAVFWVRLFPSLARLDRLDQLVPEAVVT